MDVTFGNLLFVVLAAFIVSVLADSLGWFE